MNSVDEQEGTAWYKQFWGWFVFMPLFVVIIASMFFVSTAFKHADDVVIDNYYQEGRTINQSFAQDQEAKRLGLRGELRFDRVSGEILLELIAKETLPSTLVLELSHPANEDYDQRFELRSNNGHLYRGDLDRPLNYRWYVRVQAPVETSETEGEVLSSTPPWRLNSFIDFAQTEHVVFGN
jgi:hypothetical protein